MYLRPVAEASPPPRTRDQRVRLTSTFPLSRREVRRIVAEQLG
jgi:hypothetical protein